MDVALAGEPGGLQDPVSQLSRRARRELRRRRQWRTARRGLTTGAVALVLVLSAVLAAETIMDRSTADASRPEVALELPRPAVVPIAARDETVAITTTTTTLPPGPPLPADSGTGRRIVYCNSCQRVWLVEADGRVSSSFLVSGRRGMPRPGTYEVFRKLENGWSKADPGLRLPYFVGFTWGPTTDIGFHGIPIDRRGQQVQSDAQLGTFRSSGCIRQNQADALRLYAWAPMGTTVVVTP